MSADEDARRLAASTLAAGNATGWFEQLYCDAETGGATVPWDLPRPSALLEQWARRDAITGDGRSALVVGCGLGRDAEFLARLGFATCAFDISETAIRTARRRHPHSSVDYRVADLLAPPAQWRDRFDLVVESNNVQALPAPLRAQAIANVGPMVAPGGTLLVLAFAATGEAVDGPPWPLTRAEVEAFAAPGLSVVSIEEIPDADDPLIARWRAQWRR